MNLTIEFENEHTMVMAGSTCNELGLERIIRGNRGNIYVGGPNAVLRPERIYADEVEEREIPVPADLEGTGRAGAVAESAARGTPPADVRLTTGQSLHSGGSR